MISLLKLPKTSRSRVIAFSDVLTRDILLWLASAAGLMLLTYGIGWLVSSSDTRGYPTSYYAQIVFMNTPLAGLVLIILTSLLASGLKRDARFWSIATISCLAWLILQNTLSHRLDPSGMLVASSSIVLSASLWRIWDIIDLKIINKLVEPTVSKPAVAAYLVLATISVVLLLPI